MVLIPKGQELIRDFVDPVKWMSSDYKMSIPGTKKEKNVKEELAMIQKMDLDYQEMRNGNMPVEEIQKDIDTVILEVSLGLKKIPPEDYMK